MNLYNETCYKKIITNHLVFRKSIRSHYTFEAMAKACNVQKTYLSKVLKHEGNLNLDQLFAACEYLKLNHLETEYVFTLYHIQTSQNLKRKEIYRIKLEEIRSKSQSTDSKLQLKKEVLSNHPLTEYYADPYFSLIHMFLTIAEYSQDQKKIELALQLDTKKMAHYLDRLETMGIIKQEDDSWQVTRELLHLPENSPFVKAHRTLLRLKSMEKIEKLNTKDFYSFSVVFSSEESIKREIQEKYFSFLDEVKKLVEKGKEKDVYQLNFDLLKWS